jgi:hypothetical protein
VGRRASDRDESFGVDILSLEKLKKISGTHRQASLERWERRGSRLEVGDSTKHELTLVCAPRCYWTMLSSAFAHHQQHIRPCHLSFTYKSGLARWQSRFLKQMFCSPCMGGEYAPSLWTRRSFQCATSVPRVYKSPASLTPGVRLDTSRRLTRIKNPRISKGIGVTGNGIATTVRVSPSSR